MFKNNEPTIICTKCKRTLPATHNYFHRDKKSKHGLYHVCRECRGYKFGEILRLTNQGNCNVGGCNKKAIKNGYCNAHNLKYKKYGDPLFNGRREKYKPKPRKCLECDVEFIPKKEQETKPVKYCSKKCKIIAHKKLMTKPKPKCVVCDKEMRRFDNKHCSDKCYKVSLEKQKEQTRVNSLITCSVCGKEYESRKNRDSKYCSRECYNLIHKICQHCGKEFSGNEHSKYCSEKCQRNAYNKINPWRNRESAHRRKARIKKVRVGHVSGNVIYQRDNGKCQICRKMVDITLRHPHPMSASIDHIVPIALGGSHENKNVQLTHLICNMKKGTSAVNEQLILFN